MVGDAAVVLAPDPCVQPRCRYSAIDYVYGLDLSVTEWADNLNFARDVSAAADANIAATVHCPCLKAREEFTREVGDVTFASPAGVDPQSRRAADNSGLIVDDNLTPAALWGGCCRRHGGAPGCKRIAYFQAILRGPVLAVAGLFKLRQ